MDDKGGDPSKGPEQIDAELERLKAERDDLEARVEKLEARPERRRRVRRVLTPILVIITVIVFTATVPAAWGARTVLNTDRYVETVAPLAEDPAVQASIATKVTDQVFMVLNVEGVIADALSAIGERAAVLAGPLTNAIRGFVQQQVLRVVESDAFETFWTEANRFVHTRVIAILEGNEGEAITTAEGKVLLNLIPLVNFALVQIEGVASDLVGRDVSLPQIETNEAPSQAISKLEQALGIDLPDSFGQVVVYDADDLEALQRSVSFFERILLLLLILIPVLIALSLWTSVRKRRTLIQLCVGAAIGLVLVRRTAIIARDDLFESVDTENFPSVRVLANELMDSLFRYTGILLAIVLFVLLIALVTGPYGWAATLRGWVRDAGQGLWGAISGEAVADTGRTRWIREHRQALILTGALVAVAVVFLVDLSFLGLLIVGIIVGLYELALWRLGGAEEVEPQAPTAA